MYNKFVGLSERAKQRLTRSTSQSSSETDSPKHMPKTPERRAPVENRNEQGRDKLSEYTDDRASKNVISSAKDFLGGLDWRNAAGNEEESMPKQPLDYEQGEGLLDGSDDEDDFVALSQERVRSESSNNLDSDSRRNNASATNIFGEPIVNGSDTKQSDDVDLLNMGGVQNARSDNLASDVDLLNISEPSHFDMLSGNSDVTSGSNVNSSDGTFDPFAGLTGAKPENVQSSKPEVKVNNAGFANFDPFGGSSSSSNTNNTFDPFGGSGNQDNNTFDPFANKGKSEKKQNDTFDPFGGSKTVENDFESFDPFAKKSGQSKPQDDGVNLLGSWTSNNITNSIPNPNIPRNNSGSNLRQSHSASNLNPGMTSGIPRNNSGTFGMGGMGQQQQAGIGASRSGNNSPITIGRQQGSAGNQQKSDPFAEFGKMFYYLFY